MECFQNFFDTIGNSNSNNMNLPYLKMHVTYHSILYGLIDTSTIKNAQLLK